MGRAKDVMQFKATNKSAALTGLYAGFVGLVLGPRVDAGNSLWLLISVVAFAAPAYFFCIRLVSRRNGRTMDIQARTS